MTFLDEFKDNDDAFHKDRYFLTFYNYLLHHRDPVLAIHLARMQHEGTFYKAHHLKKLIPLIQKSSIFKRCTVRPCTLVAKFSKLYTQLHLADNISPF